MRMRRNNWGAYASLLGLTSGCLVAVGCSDQAPYDSGEIGSHSDGVIIGSNDLIKVTAGGANLPAKYQSFVNAFGRLHMGSGLCTATHLGNGIAISAGHCWSATATRQNNTSCSGDYVEWGYINGATASRSDCTTVLAKQQSSGTNRLDYAIFRVSPIPPNFVAVDMAQKAPSGAKLTIFSHPQGRPLEWSQTCALQSPGSTQLSYQCDTEGGSSGATVLEDDTLKVTGIHWGGGGSANSATYILSTPIGEFLQPDGGGGTGGTGGAGGADGGGKDGAAGSAGKADGGDAATGDASDAASDATSDGSTPRDGAAGSAGSAGSAGAAGAAGSAGAAGTGGAGGAAGTAGTGGTAGKAGSGGSGGTAGTGGTAGKAGAAGSGGATGGTGGTGGTTAGAAGSGGAAGGSAGSSSGGKGGTGGSTTGSGGSGASDDGGCSCRIGAQGSSSGDHLGGLLAAFAVGVVGLRRGRRKPSRT